jgi:hypothetical protein
MAGRAPERRGKPGLSGGVVRPPVVSRIIADIQDGRLPGR